MLRMNVFAATADALERHGMSIKTLLDAEVNDDTHLNMVYASMR
jgi:hypothetical protein